MLSEFSNILGMIGVIFILIAYYLLNINSISAKSLTYLLANLVGSCLVLISLYYHFNLASVIIELAWISISLLGLYRLYQSQKNL